MGKGWNGGKAQKIDKEFGKIQKLSNDNKYLKEEVERLQKKLDRIESGWCANCIKNYEVGDAKHPPKLAKTKKKVEKAEEKPKSKDRTCYKCKTGKLKIVKYPKLGEIYYFRKCESCTHRTRAKKYDDKVED
jgi:predicted RNase H-like nuclease (RuvC/YqgF family)